MVDTFDQCAYRAVLVILGDPLRHIALTRLCHHHVDFFNGGYQREAFAHLLGNILPELDDFYGPSIDVQDGVVARLQPNIVTLFGDPTVLFGDILAATQCLPHLVILGACRLDRIDEQAVMLAFDLVERIAHRFQEVVVGGQHMAIHRELDDRLRPTDRRQLAVIVGVECVLNQLLRNVLPLDDGAQVPAGLLDRIQNQRK